MENIRGMAPTPDQLDKLREARETQPKPEKKKKVREPSSVVTMRNDSPPLKQEITQIIYGLHWQYNKRILDLIKVAVPDKKWDTVRVLVMDVQNEHIESLRILVGQRITDYISKENKDINGTENGVPDGK